MVPLSPLVQVAGGGVGASLSWDRLFDLSVTSPGGKNSTNAGGTQHGVTATVTTQGYDTALLARRMTESYLIQLLRHGFFHADPHPGNLSVDTRGNLVFYDFGMMGELGSAVRENLLELFYGIYSKDTSQVSVPSGPCCHCSCHRMSLWCPIPEMRANGVDLNALFEDEQLTVATKHSHRKGRAALARCSSGRAVQASSGHRLALSLRDAVPITRPPLCPRCSKR